MNIPSSINEIENVVGTSKGFFEELLDTDDWSFVIKLHAFFESIFTQLLLSHFKQPELKDILSRLELSNKTTGKIAFLEKLNLISKEDRRFISALSELRNKLVHDVFNCEFKFVDYLDTLDSDSIKNLAISFSPFETFIRNHKTIGLSENTTINEISKQVDIGNIVVRFKENPKEHIHVGARNVLVNIIDAHYYSDYQHWVQANKQLGTNAVAELKIEVLKDIEEIIASRKKSNSKQ